MTVIGDGAPVTPQPGPADVHPSSGGAVSQFEELLQNAIHMGTFFVQSCRSIPRAVRAYPSEVLRQCGIIIISSGVIIWLMELIMGAVFAVQGHYITRQFGAPGYVGIYPALGGLRTAGPEMWGWILSAKVGCGLVAEIGSMRISEEIDALELMGIEPVPYLVGTRVLAAMIAMPFLYIVGLGLLYLGSWFMIVKVLHTVSPGGFSEVLWSFQSPLDLLFSVIWTIVLGLLVVLVGCHYGYTAKGGPVGVEINTSKSMVVNMVLVSLVGLIFQMLFWGGFANAPIAN